MCNSKLAPFPKIAMQDSGGCTMKSTFGWQTKKIIISIKGLLKKREY